MIDPRTNHAYRPFFGVQSWGQARLSCERIGAGAHLATIADAEEQKFLAQRIAADVWIGATDQQQEGAFVWVTGEPFVFSNFIPGELGNARMNARYDCVALGADRFWHDRSCGTEALIASLCEVEP